MVVEIFKKLTKLKRCSFNTEEIEEFIIEYSKKYGYKIKRDSYGNILAYKNTPKLAFQAHLDMVCVGDYENIEVIEEDGFLRAKNSSLGADNGVGIAIMLYLMSKYDDLEFLFTKDEEVGLIGAINLELSIKSKYLVNLDSEDDEVIIIGSAGGFDVEIEYEESFEEIRGVVGEIVVDKLPGGHSGIDIDKNIPNAIKELLKRVEYTTYLKGGERRNSIPLKAFSKEVFSGDEVIKVYSKEYISFLKNLPHGVLEYDFTYKVPLKSVNFALLDGFKSVLSARAGSNKKLDELKEYIIEKVKHTSYKITSFYPAWEGKENSLSVLLQKITKAKPIIIHAGLECGILQNKLNVEIVSYGPLIKNPHSIRERVKINSIYKVLDSIEKLYENIS